MASDRAGVRPNFAAPQSPSSPVLPTMLPTVLVSHIKPKVSLRSHVIQEDEGITCPADTHMVT